jgi:hypothetical protein
MTDSPLYNTRNRKTSVAVRGVRLLCVLFSFAVLVCGCYRDNEESLYPKAAYAGGVGCDTVNISYDRTVKYIFQRNCAIPGCHASGSATGGYTLDNYAGVRSVVLSGRIIGAITHAPGYVHMPKNGTKLDDCQLGQIISWINQGAQNN